GRNEDLDGFGMRRAAFTTAGGANVFQTALATATRAGQVESHVARHLAHVAGAIAFGARRGAVVIAAGPMAGGALVEAWYLHLLLLAFDGFPETDIEGVFEIGAFFGRWLGSLTAATFEELAEDVPERAGAGCAPRRPA